MRVWTRRHIGVVCLNVLLALGGASCSSSQQDDEQLENYENQEGQQEEYAEQGQEEYQQQGDEDYQQQGQGDEEYAQQGEDNEYGEDENYAENEEGGDNYAANEGNNNYGGNEEGGNNYAAEGEGENSYGQGEEGGDNYAQVPEGNETVEQAAITEDAGAQDEVVEELPAAGAENYGDAAPVEADTAVAAMPTGPTVDVSTSSQGGLITGLAGAQAGQGLPELGSKMPYIVRSGDTLGKISGMIYGTSQKWREIAALSGLDNPNSIFPGDVVYYQLTESTVAFAQAQVSVPRQEVVVQHGDTLATISRRAFGSDRFWKSIWRENDHIVNPDELVVGTTVYYATNVAMAETVKAFRHGTQLVKLEKARSEAKSGVIVVNTLAPETNDADFEFEALDLSIFAADLAMNDLPRTTDNGEGQAQRT